VVKRVYTRTMNEATAAKVTPSTPIDRMLPGTRWWDASVGTEVTVRGRPRRVAGGYAVDVTSALWNGKPYDWTAAVCNLRPLEER
jgi:hypothetical protein